MKFYLRHSNKRTIEKQRYYGVNDLVISVGGWWAAIGGSLGAIGMLANQWHSDRKQKHNDEFAAKARQNAHVKRIFTPDAVEALVVGHDNTTRSANAIGMQTLHRALNTELTHQDLPCLTVAQLSKALQQASDGVRARNERALGSLSTQTQCVPCPADTTQSYV